ncbi:MAG: FHA domain-containing protein [Planctomycetes bacterium]|nr:FHA domain-containing protein [Planctomycetota bacterium]
MLYIFCQCGHRSARPDESAGRSLPCDGCGRIVTTLLADQCKADGSLDSRIAFSAKLTILQGPGRIGEQILITGPGAIDIGKTHDKRLVLTGAGVSRTHAQLLCEANLWRIEDLNSHNGTKVNGAKVQTRILKDGDKLGIGEYEIVFNTM